MSTGKITFCFSGVLTNRLMAFEVVLDSVRIVVNEHEKSKYERIADEYNINNTSWRALKLIIGNAGLSNKWSGIIKN